MKCAATHSKSLTHKPQGEKKMTDKEKRDELILINGEYYSQKELVAIIESNRELAKRCERQSNFIRALKLQNEELTHELEHIKGMSMFEFGNRYCTSESLEADGHAFARALGVGQ